MHISIIDDERILTSKISKKLRFHKYVVSEFYSYEDFMLHGINVTPSDLYIVDLSFEDGSGFEIIKALRAKQIASPIIIISGFNDTNKKVFGLDLGADDYLSKPFSPDELLARIRAILRRSEIQKMEEEIYEHNNLILNTAKKEVLLNGVKVDLTKKEYAITELFLVNKGKTIERASIVRRVWGSQDTMDVTDNTINVTFSKLKKKLGESFELKTKYGYGFILE